MTGPVVGVSPGAAYGNAKRWLPERFAESARQVAVTLGARVAVFGSAGERELCEKVMLEVRRAGVQARNLAGETSLREFIELAAACRVFLTNDSGAMHVASAPASRPWRSSAPPTMSRRARPGRTRAWSASMPSAVRVCCASVRSTTAA